MLKQKSLQRQGNIGVGAAIAHYTAKGFIVCIPLSEQQPYDLIVENPDDGKLLKVQVKTTRYKPNDRKNFIVQLATAGWSRGVVVKEFNRNSVDVLFVLTEDQEKYEIPSTEIRGVRAITLCDHYNKWRV